MNELENAIIIEPPLRGEWSALTTPAKTIPSHGTDQLGQRYAYDFVKLDWHHKGMRFYNASNLRYYTLGVPLKRCYGWGEDVYAPCDGKIIKVRDGYQERNPVHYVSDFLIILKNALTFNPDKTDIQLLVGNYIILEFNNIYAFFAHLQTGSINVSEGQQVKVGDLLGKVGHSGNSTAPHLHFQLMDSAELLKAQGIPCAFRQYQIYQNDQWITVNNGIPSDTEPIRF